jgi:uncharacterized protein (UPF0248 family)
VIPIHALLARIRWDPSFGRGRWEIAYLDRARTGLVRLPLDAVRTQAHIGFVFDVVDEEGVARSIPYHRVRQVFQDGRIVWSRLAPKKLTKERKPRPLRRQAARRTATRRPGSQVR